MTVYTSRFGFQWNYAPHAVGWGDGYNTGFRTIAAMLHPVLISDIVDAPPSSPNEGDAYFTPTTATGAWAPYALKIASWQGGAWQFYPPVAGLRVFFVNHAGFYFWNGATWSPESNLTAPVGSVLSVAGHPPDGAGNVALNYNDISGAAPLSSPNFSGVPTGPTATAHNNSLQLATTAYVDGAFAAMGGVVSLTQGTGILITGTSNYTISSNTAVMATRAYVDAAVAGVAVTQPYIIAGFFAGVPTASQVMLVHRCATAITFPSNFGTTTSGANTGGGCLIDATASTTISVDKCLAASDPTVNGNWTQIGTLTISAGGHTASLATVGGTGKSAASGDFLRAAGPATADATAANIFITLAGDR
jgi:hypothetical protein